MEFNSAGLQIIKESEGCSLTAYQDQKGIWTIGWGSTRYVTQGMVVTTEEACIRLETDIQDTVNVLKFLLRLRPVNDNQFSACTSLAFNIGVGNFKMSTLLNCILHNNLDDAAKEFLKWVKVNGVPNEGLLTRRKREQMLFLTPIPTV